MKSDTRQRLLGIGILVAILFGAIAAWQIITPEQAVKPVRPASILDSPPDVGFDQDSETTEILKIASEEADKLRTTYPDSPAALSAIARMHMLIGEQEKARAAWQDACRIQPGFAEGLYGLGIVSFEDDDYETAMGYYEDAACVGPNDLRIPVAVADCLLRLGKPEQAKLVLLQHIAKEQSTVEAQLRLGQANLQLKHYDEAAKCYKTILSFDANSRDALFGLMRSLTGAGKKDEAREYNTKFRELAQQEREDSAAKANAFSDYAYAASVASQVYWDASRIHKSMGDLAKSEDMLRKAVATAPEAVEYLESLRQLLQDQQRSSEALDVAERIVELSPGDADALFDLATLLAEIEDHERAIAIFKQAAEAAPDSEMSKRIAVVLAQLNAS